MLRLKDVWFCPEYKVDRNLPEDNPIMIYAKGQRKYSLENKWGDLECFYTGTGREISVGMKTLMAK